MTKEVWKKGEEGAKMLVEYVKNIGLYYGLYTPTLKQERRRMNKKRRRNPQMDMENE
jgi:hypothetical protein